MYQGEPLRKFTYWFNLDAYFRFTPFLWDSDSQVFQSTTSLIHLMQFRISALALVLKTCFLIGQGLRLYFEGEIGNLVFQIFFIGPSALAVIFDVYWARRPQEYLTAFSKLSQFCTAAALRYKESLGVFDLMPELPPLVVSCSAPVIVIPVCTAILHFEVPDMPQFLFYALKGMKLGFELDQVGFGLPFLLLTIFEGFIMYKAWYTCVTFCVIWSASCAPISFWISQIKYAFKNLNSKWLYNTKVANRSYFYFMGNIT